MINLVLVYAVLKLFFSSEFGKPALIHTDELISDPELAEISKRLFSFCWLLLHVKFFS